jgi:hypothetical protein
VDVFRRRPEASYTIMTKMTTKTMKAIPAHQAQRVRQPPTATLALVPATLLPYRTEWQRLANALPARSILLCVPCPATAARRRIWETLMSRMVVSMAAAGYHVFVLHGERFLRDVHDLQGLLGLPNPLDVQDVQATLNR